MRFSFFIIFIFTICANFCLAQDKSEQKNIQNGEIEVAHIFTGKYYSPTYQSIENGPFYIPSESSKKCSITYEGVKYENIDLRYDIFDQQIVLLLKTSSVLEYIYLDRQKVSEFEIGDHYFSHLKENGDLKSGFFEVVHSHSTIRLLAKRRKWKSEKTSESGYVVKFETESDYYIQNGDNAFRIAGKKDLHNALKPTKNVTKKLVELNLKFKRKTLEADLLQVLAIFDSNRNRND